MGERRAEKSDLFTALSTSPGRPCCQPARGAHGSGSLGLGGSWPFEKGGSASRRENRKQAEASDDFLFFPSNSPLLVPGPPILAEREEEASLDLETKPGRAWDSAHLLAPGHPPSIHGCALTSDSGLWSLLTCSGRTSCTHVGVLCPESMAGHEGAMSPQSWQAMQSQGDTAPTFSSKGRVSRGDAEVHPRVA